MLSTYYHWRAGQRGRASHGRFTCTTVLYPLAPLHFILQFRPGTLLLAMIPRIHSSRTRESAQRSNFQNICTEHLNMEKKNICQVHCGGNKYRSERRARRPRRRQRRTQGDGLARTKRRQGVMRSARDRTVQATEPAAFSPLAIMLPAGGAFSVFS
jgi:hypothetical protein